MNNTQNQSVPIAAGSLTVAITYGTLGGFGLVANLMVTLVLPSCDQLSYSARALMILLCCSNMLGLTPATFYSPIVASRGSSPEIPFLRRLAGFMLVTAVFTNLALSACIAVNRWSVMKSRALHARIFTPNRTRLACFLCVLCGSSWGILTLFDCCIIEFNPSLLKWFYQGPSSAIQLQYANTYIWTILALCTVVYLATFMQYRKFQ